MWHFAPKRDKSDVPFGFCQLHVHGSLKSVNIRKPTLIAVILSKLRQLSTKHQRENIMEAYVYGQKSNEGRSISVKREWRQTSIVGHFPYNI